MTGNQRIVILSMLSSIITSVVGSVLLIPLYDSLGAAIAAAAAVCVANTVQLLVGYQLLQSWPYNRQYLKPLIAGSASTAAAFLAGMVLPLPEGPFKKYSSLLRSFL
jgi:O-antigen/teichoic acid export membrane protein